MESRTHESHDPEAGSAEPSDPGSSVSLPRVAIVGRPNTGKSTLFNRFVGRRRAITDPTPGVTRDPIEVRVELSGRPIVIIDTGGYTTDRDELARLISGRALSAIESADVILFLVDATGATALDREFLELLNTARDRIILVVNKVDSADRESLVWDFYEFGIESVIAVSSAHGLGMNALEAAIGEKLADVRARTPVRTAAASTEQPDRESGEGLTPDVTRLAVLGRPNTGKSTLVNRLTDSDRSMVSDVPGTTRDVIEGGFTRGRKRYAILDTAGIRRKSRVSENIEYYSVTRAIDSIDDAEVVVLVVDVVRGLSDQDKKIAGLIVDRGRGLVLALNKWDLLPDVPNQFTAVSDRIRFQFPVLSFAPMVALSAQNGLGVDALIREVDQVRSQLNRRVDTGLLNRHLKAWLERTPPPVVGRRGRPKMRYITQATRFPMTFVAFVNRKKDFTDSYVGYLKNQIRADFGLTKIPFRLELRERE
ncbi:MAG: ribosome biogenesis GTPase Der [Spirochaetaceae bacterium]|nr:MAG: ribosome biogenesis GTPase Der [Spirochaetaceae bacterium]